MAAPIFIHLTPEEDAQLQKLLSDPNTHPKVRQRALAVRLSAQHWSAPRIAQFLGCHHTTVLNDLKTVAKTPLRRTCRWQSTRRTPKNHLRSEGVLDNLAFRRPHLDCQAAPGSLSEPDASAGASCYADPPLEADGVCLQAHPLCAWGCSRGVCGGSLPLRVGGDKKGVVAGRCRVWFLDESGFGV